MMTEGLAGALLSTVNATCTPSGTKALLFLPQWMNRILGFGKPIFTELRRKHQEQVQKRWPQRCLPEGERTSGSICGNPRSRATNFPLQKNKKPLSCQPPGHSYLQQDSVHEGVKFRIHSACQEFSPVPTREKVYILSQNRMKTQRVFPLVSLLREENWKLLLLCLSTLWQRPGWFIRPFHSLKHKTGKTRDLAPKANVLRCCQLSPTTPNTTASRGWHFPWGTFHEGVAHQWEGVGHHGGGTFHGGKAYIGLV